MNKLLTKLSIAVAGMAMAIGVGVGLGQKSFNRIQASENDETTLFDVTDKNNWGTSKNSYSADEWTDATQPCTFAYASNNQKGWAYIRMGGKSVTTNADSYIKCNTATTSPTKAVKVTVVTVKSNADLTINSVKLFVYSDDDFDDEHIVDEVDFDLNDYTATTISFSPSNDYVSNYGANWATGVYFKYNVNWTNSINKNYGTDISKIVAVEGAASTTTVTAMSITGGPAKYSEGTWTGYDTDTINISDFTITGTISTGSWSAAAYSFSGVGVKNGNTFTPRAGSAEFTSFKPLSSENNMRWTASYPTVAGQSTYLTVDVTLSVSADSVSSIAVSGSMTRTTYSSTGEWDPSGLTVEATCVSTNVIDVTDDATLTFYNSSNEVVATPSALGVGDNQVLKVVATYSGVSNLEKYVASSRIRVVVYVTDTLTRPDTGIADGTTSYSGWSGVSKTSEAIYAGNSAGNHDSVQIRGTANSSGVVSTSSGGNIRKVAVTWESNTGSGRTLNVYGSNTAYSSAADLASSETYGELLGTIVYGTSTELEINDDYKYVGIVVATSNAAYLTNISFTWEPAAEKTVTSLSASSPKVTTGWYVGDIVTLAKAGVTITATYDDESQEDVTGKSTITSGGTIALGPNTVTVSYKGETCSFNLTGVAATSYTKITSVTDLVVGGSIYLGAYYESTYYFMAGQESTVRSTHTATVTNNAVSGTIEISKLTVGANKNGYYFQDLEGKYLCLTSDSTILVQANELDDTNLYTYWTASISDGIATITNVAFNTKSIAFNYNSGNTRFSSYNGQTKPSIYVANVNSVTSEQKVNTFCALYMHTEIIDNETTRASDTETCFDYFDAARAALDPESGAWSSIAEAFSQSTYWERYVKWGKARGVEVSYSDGIHYSGRTTFDMNNISQESNNTLIAIIIIASVSALAVGGYFFIRRKHQ